MADKTFNLKVVGSLRDLKGLLDGSLTSFRIPDGVTSLGFDRFYHFTQLTDLDFNQVEVIPDFTCHGCTNLANVTFTTNTTSIGEYAFYGCTKFKDTELPHTITSVGSYAFYQAGKNTHTFSFIDNQGVETSIKDRAFYESHLSDLEGTYVSVGQYAISGCSSLTKVRLLFDNATISSYAFFNCSYVNDFEYDKDSTIKNLEQYAFGFWGYSRSGTDYFLWDMTKAGFNSVPSYCWNYNKYSIILLPSNVANINYCAFEHNDHLILYLNSLPTLSSTTGFQSNTNLQIVVNYILDETALQSMTNWTTYASNIVSGITGYVGVLPPYTDDTGVAITWYSDSSHTTEVTTSSSASDVFYAVKGNERLVWHVNTRTLDASVTISDGSVTYESFIPVNTTVTITPSYTDPTKDQLYLLKVNGVDYTSAGTATVQVTEDLNIVALYWNGTDQLFMPTLADNNWDMIKLASKCSAVPSTWNVGDTKTLTYNGTTFTARLIDKTGKFTRVADGSTAYLYFELTESLATTEKFTLGGNNSVEDSSLLASMNSGTIWNNLDSGLTSALEEVNVKVMSKGWSGGSLIDFPAKVFLGREHDLFSTRTYCAQAEWNAIAAQDEYYQTHNTGTDRVKIQKGGRASTYLLISPRGDSETNVICVKYDGSRVSDYIGYLYAVALRFAL